MNPGSTATASRLRATLGLLAADLEQLRLRLAPEEAVGLRDRALDDIRAHLLPRLDDPDLPLVVALVGPTGAGKSTLLNSLAGHRVSAASVIRPTTDRPVVWSSKEVRELGEWVRSDVPLAEHLAVVDTPDIDSVVTRHRAAARRVLTRADVAIYVTTPLRYADAASRELLEWAARRLPVLVVVNRVGKDTVGVPIEVGRAARSLGGRPLTVLEQHPVEPGRLHPEGVAHLQDALKDLAARRDEIRSRAMAGTAREVVAAADEIGNLVDQESQHLDRLLGLADAAFRRRAARWLNPDHTSWSSLRAVEDTRRMWSADPIGRRLLDVVPDPDGDFEAVRAALRERLLRLADPPSVADTLRMRARSVLSDLDQHAGSA
jgi:energy-coupling factor transporter ATP-binding protein EcfA2